MTAKKPPATRSDFRHFLRIPTRWADVDIYGHVNNVVYYAYFDTVVNEYLIKAGVLSPAESEVIGLVVETRCRFHKSLGFPGTVDAGIFVSRLGKTSVTYEIGLFDGDSEIAAADGHFIHVYVDRNSRRPSPLPKELKRALSILEIS
ncbi:MAG: thioesterase family protein [Pseudomonadota bacterium]